MRRNGDYGRLLTPMESDEQLKQIAHRTPGIFLSPLAGSGQIRSGALAARLTRKTESGNMALC